jgi:DNA-binding MarR family transcriptional regulator
MAELDRVIHEQARLLIVTLLATVQEADFLYLLQASELTKGNLSTHLAKLEQVGYVEIEKAFRGKIPLTLARLTPQGLAAFKSYRREMTALLKVSKRSRGSAIRSLVAAPQRASSL